MELANRMKARDANAMAELYDLYSRLVFRVIARAVGNESVAEDLTQEAFLRVWNGIKGFDEERGALGSWIRAVARNTDRLPEVAGSAASRTAVGLKEMDGVRRHGSLEDWVVNFDRARTLREAFQKLNASQRLVLNLSFVEGMSHAEIARKIDRPLGTVKTWVRTAMRALSTQLALEPTA